jgi:integrase/recombinase XerC
MKQNHYEELWDLLEKYHEKMTLKGLKEKYARERIRDLEKFFVYLEEKTHGKTVLRAAARDIEEYFAVLEPLVVPYSYNRKLNSLCCFYEYLKEEGKVLLNPAEDMRSKRSIRRESHSFTEEEMKSILESMDETPVGKRDRAMIETLYSTGMRLKELRGLATGDVDFREKEIVIRQGKGDKERIVPAGTRSLTAIEDYLKVRYVFMFPGREGDTLFLNRYGNGIDSAGIRRAFYRWKQKAGVTTPGSLHTIRHSFACHLLSRGASLEMIRRMLGHEHLTSTQEYAGLSDDELQKMYEKCHPRSQEA